jgi:hypothetical protein
MNAGSELGDGDHQSRSLDKIVWQFILQTTVTEERSSVTSRPESDDQLTAHHNFA